MLHSIKLLTNWFKTTEIFSKTINKRTWRGNLSSRLHKRSPSHTHTKKDETEESDKKKHQATIQATQSVDRDAINVYYLITISNYRLLHAARLSRRRGAFFLLITNQEHHVCILFFVLFPSQIFIQNKQHDWGIRIICKIIFERVISKDMD